MEQNIRLEDEPKVVFRSISDRSVYNIINDEIKQTLVEISGYDLQINFNLEYINSIEDVEAAVGGLGDLFRQIIMDKLLEYKKQND
jgi:hypothetical protein